MRHHGFSGNRGAGGGASLLRRGEDLAVDLAMVHLLRLARADDWHPDVAGRHLRAILDRTGNAAHLLRLARGRVQRAMLERPSLVAERAIATVDAALDEPARRPA